MEKSKSDIRKEKLKLRRALSSEIVNSYSDSILDKLACFDSFIDCKSLLIYSDYNNEVKTNRIIENAFKANIDVYLPKVMGDEMEFYLVDSFDALAASSMGILEPEADSCLKFNGNDNSTVIIPLSAFDRNGNRIGYGGGYYDKYLQRVKVGTKIGLAYSIQECESIPVEKTDIKLDYIITEKEIIEVKNNG